MDHKPLKPKYQNKQWDQSIPPPELQSFPMPEDEWLQSNPEPSHPHEGETVYFFEESCEVSDFCWEQKSNL